ncbi:MAG: A/G-specific adenine glycosylase [Myxococcales bacterium]|nr:A/G-specific adenine glycosylase [Myxococcales bacterium]
MIAALRSRLLAHYRRTARDLPFRRTRDPYAIWICEVMAQQTRLQTVLPYWERWMARFPTVRALADAPLGDVLAAWTGLGYYARARSLHAAARIVVDRYVGQLPDDLLLLRALPGIGDYTAGAIASIAFGRRVPAVDGNVARVLCRVFAIDEPSDAPATRRQLWQLAGTLVAPRAAGDFNQALMELGALTCTPRSPSCSRCPLAPLCTAHATGRTAELPRRTPRRPPRALTIDLALITDPRGRWLVGKRAPQGRYGGLWELPELAALQSTAAHLVVDNTPPLAETTHSLTHLALRYRVLSAHLPRLPRAAPPYELLRRIAPRALTQLGVSAATLRLIAMLQTPSWTTAPIAHRSSSAKASRKSSRG